MLRGGFFLSKTEQEKKKRDQNDQNTTPSNLSAKAAITIQKNVRGFLARKKYQIKHLSTQEQTDYSTFVVGNDPVMPPSLDLYNEPKEKIAFIATSGMRALSLACKLGNPENTPKIILIDNSKQVYAFWYAMREFAEDDLNAATEKLFLKNLPSFLQFHKNKYRDLEDDAFLSDTNKSVKYLHQNIETYFKALIKKYGYTFVRSVLVHASLIKQSWADINVFAKIKNILNYHGIDKIYLYPSNIVAVVQDPRARNQILKNIEKIDPALSIHTDRCPTHNLPENVYLLKNNNPNYVSNTLFGQKQCNPDPGINLNNLDLNFLNDALSLLRTLKK